MKCLVFLTFFFVGFCSCEISIQNLPNLPDASSLNGIKERCDKKGGPGTFDKLKTTSEEVKTCLQGLIDPEKVKTEVEEAKKTGSMDEVFGKYCNKRPQIKGCIDKGIDAAKPCLEENEKDALNVTLNILRELGEFVCYRDGDRIAMFVAEGGVDCLKDHAEGVKNCVNATLKINPNNLSDNVIPDLTISKQKCDDLTTIQNCVVEELEKCKDSTPANIMDALFRFIKKSICKEKKHRRSIFKRDVKKSIAETSYHYRNHFLDKIVWYCQSNGEADALQHLRESVFNSKECIGSVFTAFGENYTTILPKCFNETVKSAEACLPAEMKYFPSFVFNVTMSLTQFMRANLDNFKLSTTNLDIDTCFRSLKQDISRRALLKCLTDAQEGLNNATTLTKDVTCKKMTDLSMCISDIIKNVCIRDIKLDQIRLQFVEALTKPCNE